MDLSVKNQEFTLENNDYKLETPFKLLIQGNPKVYEFMKWAFSKKVKWSKEKCLLGLTCANYMHHANKGKSLRQGIATFPR